MGLLCVIFHWGKGGVAMCKIFHWEKGWGCFV